MNILWTVLLSLIFQCCSIVLMDHSTDIPIRMETKYNKPMKQERILRGFDCDPTEFPYYVLIMEKIKDALYKTCGGSLITPLLVLTACHCIDKSYPQYAGVMMDTEYQQIREVSHYHQHPDFRNDTMDNDIAIFVLKEPMDRPKNKQVFAKLPRNTLRGDIRDFCETAFIMGYGTTEKAMDSHTLQCVILPVISTSDCKTYYGAMIAESDFCTLSSEGKDACQGDSGGPIICEEVQVGIISWGYKCGKRDKPGVYVRIDKYLDFLERIHIIEEKSANSVASIRHSTNRCHYVTAVIVFSIIKVIF